jgi:hypothetical protein
VAWGCGVAAGRERSTAALCRSRPPRPSNPHSASRRSPQPAARWPPGKHRDKGHTSLLRRLRYASSLRRMRRFPCFGAFGAFGAPGLCDLFIMVWRDQRPLRLGIPSRPSNRVYSQPPPRGPVAAPGQTLRESCCAKQCLVSARAQSGETLTPPHSNPAGGGYGQRGSRSSSAPPRRRRSA